jgi:alkaline phosphatase
MMYCFNIFAVDTEIEPEISHITPVKNIIVLLADGLSLNNKTIARIFKAGPYGSLNIDRIDNTGYMTNHSADFWISDSAANSTALSTGFKTDNGKVSVLPNGQVKSNLFERMGVINKKTAIVTDGRISSEALAPFYSHADSSEDINNIIDFLFKRNIDLIMCGGERVFIPQAEGGVRTDQKNYIEEAQRLGYRFINSKDALRNFSFSEKMLGVFAEENLPYEIDRKDDNISLSEMVRKSLDMLSGEKDGFFLLIENSNLFRTLDDLDLKSSVEEIAQIDRITGMVDEFIKKDKDTLFLILSGFDCGGLTITADFNPLVFDTLKVSILEMTSKINSAGTNAEEIIAVYSGINLSRNEYNLVQTSMNTDNFRRTVSSVLCARSGVNTIPADSINRRTATVTPIWAMGKHSEFFRGFHDNTDIGSIILELSGIK